MMTRQLATLVTAGIPLVEAVGALIEQVEKLELKRVLTQVRDRLNEGSSLAKALEPHPKVFPNLYVNMVARGRGVGHARGGARAARGLHGERRRKLRGKVGAALAYPVLMMVIGSGAHHRHDGRRRPEGDGDLREPRPRAALVHASCSSSSRTSSRRTRCSASSLGTVTFTFTRSALRDYKESERAKHLLFVVLALVAGGLLVLVRVRRRVARRLRARRRRSASSRASVVAWLIAWLATPDGRVVEGRLPPEGARSSGTLVRMLAVSRFSRTLATLLRSGVPLLKAMEIVKNVLDNAQAREGHRDRRREHPRGRVDRRAAQAQRRLPADRDAHDRRRREERAARADARERRARLRHAGRDARAGADEPARAADDRRSWAARVGFIAFAILMPLIQMNEFVQQ